ncbi:MAG: hypothetical protein EPO19_10535 [Betaproteobacteria bacterium]|nr:MAG: hypothetical protein EPO19_10535 [Betaproteobacteria bacterium]
MAKRVEEWKKTRDLALVTRRLAQLHADARKGDRFNLMPSIIEAVKAYATAGEVMGDAPGAGFELRPVQCHRLPFRPAMRSVTLSIRRRR